MLRLIAALIPALLLASLAGAKSPVATQTLSRIDLVDFRGRTWTLDDFEDRSVIVVAFLGTECPLAKLYAVRLRELAEEYADRSVQLIAVMSNRQDSLAEITAFANRQGLEFPVLKDAGNAMADRVGAERTPEVFVFDAERRLRYRGRVDDQYGIGYVRDQPRRHDLKIALDELLAGKSVSLTQTSAAGCLIGRSKQAQVDADVTYGGQIASILTKRCVECHRDGEIAPFSLTDYEEVAGWADMIAEVVRDERMPPWHASEEHGDFANDRRLTAEEKQAFFAWAEAGAPAGELDQLPSLPAKVGGWMLPREPDLEFKVSPQPFQVPAAGAVRYQYFKVDPKLEKDVWIQAAELKPGNREVVHHILAFAVPKGQRRGIDGARGFLVGYVPGARLELAPKGHAKKIPAGSELIFQVHYTPIGTPQQDQSSLGIVLADPDQVTHEIVTTSALQTRLEIGPGDANYETFAFSPRFPADATLLSMSPHMHVRGKSYKYQLESRDGSDRTTLLDIPAYDFNWQTTYALAKPMPVEPGSRIFCTAVFDNSEANLNNPDPTQTVKWGDQTWDEMMIGYYHYSVPIGAGASKPDRREQAEALIRGSVRMRRFNLLDRDKDGKVSRKDVPKMLLKVFDQLDQNDDDVLTRKEVAAAE